ncbi:MAG: HPr family phosphocarrier protein [Ruminococcaceae bacterium]|jgi:phosphocarrier protein|nr:HPr family phosphocarrier protein [Oscillospiraceae bacterium]MBQ3599092.1 HPr family phosphocarrier protein [Clostridia bacterium]MBQ5842520.1 HPr family phosphocarrier protein [Clostridia bacterium]MBR2914275.1 HPr family phosphocarrier protein [Clostridia bacterium]
MLSKEITLVNSVGLHARPATFFIQKANSYRCSVWIENNSRRANAKSLLGVLSLGVRQGDSVTLIADGIDENEALEGLCSLILSGFAD